MKKLHEFRIPSKVSDNLNICLEKKVQIHRNKNAHAWKTSKIGAIRNLYSHEKIGTEMSKMSENDIIIFGIIVEARNSGIYS